MVSFSVSQSLLFAGTLGPLDGPVDFQGVCWGVWGSLLLWASIRPCEKLCSAALIAHLLFYYICQEFLQITALGNLCVPVFYFYIFLNWSFFF